MYSLYIFLGKLMTFTVFPKKCSRDLGRISGNESRSPEGFQKEATEKTQVLRSSLNDEVMTTAGQKGTHRRTAGSRESTGAFSSAQARPEQAGWLSSPSAKSLSEKNFSWLRRKATDGIVSLQRQLVNLQKSSTGGSCRKVHDTQIPSVDYFPAKQDMGKLCQ